MDGLTWDVSTLARSNREATPGSTKCALHGRVVAQRENEQRRSLEVSADAVKAAVDGVGFYKIRLFDSEIRIRCLLTVDVVRS